MLHVLQSQRRQALHQRLERRELENLSRARQGAGRALPGVRAARVVDSRVDGTREMVVRPNYLVVYAEDAHAVTILPGAARAAQQWPQI